MRTGGIVHFLSKRESLRKSKLLLSSLLTSMTWISSDDGFWVNSVRDLTEGERKWGVMRKDATMARITKVDSPKYGFYAINCISM